jgi:hypothetical protein
VSKGSRINGNFVESWKRAMGIEPMSEADAEAAMMEI